MFSRLNLLRKLPPVEQLAGAAITDHIPFAVLALNNDNRISYINPAAEKLFGVNAANATGQPLDKINSPLAEALQEALDSGEVNIEYQAEDRGQVQYFEVHVSLLVDRHEQSNGRVVMVHDITEQKTLAMAHARSERFQILFDKSPDAVVIIDPHSQDVSWAIIDCNPAFCRMNGYHREELIGQSIDIVHEEPDSPDNRADFFQRLHREETISGTVVHRRKDGNTYHIQYVTSLFTLEGRELVLGIDRNITKQLRVEQALREGEAQYRSVTEQNLAGVYIIQDGKFRYANPALARILGYSPDQIIDRLGPEDVVHPEDASRVMEKIRQRIEGEADVAQYQFRTERASGEVIHCEVLGRRVMYEGRPAVLGTLLDITERIRVEEALIQHVGQLELINQVSHEITAELSLDVLLAKAAELIQESFGYPHVGLFLLDREREELVMKARAGSYAALFPDDHRLKLDAGINGWVARNGERLLIGDVRADSRYYNPFPEQLILSELSVPIKWGDEVVGILDIQSEQLDAFGKNDVLVLETLADQLATVTQNARLFEYTQQTLANLVEAQETILAERDRAQQYLDMAGAIIVAIDRDQCVSLINRKGCEVLGYEQHEITGKNWFNTVIPEHERQQVIQAFDKLMAGDLESVAHFENRIVNQQGEERIIEWQNALLRDDAGQVIGTLSSGIDVTEQRRAALREQLAHEVASQLTRSLDANQLLRITIERLHAAFEYYSIHIFLLDEDSARLVVAEGLGEVGAQLIELQHNISLTAKRGLVAHAARTIKPMVVNDVRQDPHHLPNPLLPHTISEAALPLAIGQKVLGVLDIQHTIPNHFTQQEINTLQIVANQLAVALSNARLFGETQAALSELVLATKAVRAERDRAQRYLDVAGTIMVALDIDLSITLINHKGCEILGYEQQELTGQNWLNTAIPEDEKQRIKTILNQLMEGQIEGSERIESPIVTRQGEERIIDWQNALLKDDDGQVIGTLSSGVDVTQRRRAEQAEREQRLLAEVLRDNAAIINSTLDLDSVLERVLENVVRVVGYDAADILLVQDGVARITRFKGYDQYVAEEELQKIELPVNTTANLRRMIETQQPDIIADVSRVPDWTGSSAVAWIRSYIGAPIIFDGEIIGFLSLLSENPNVYQQSDAERLQAFADQAAIAIRNAQLYEQMNRYAAELEVSNERLAAYGHTIAHDLKNPLSTLLMGFEIILAESHNFSPPGQKFAQQSQKLVKTMSRTIDSLLRLAELRDDQGEIELVDMEMVVEDVLAQLMKLIMDRGVRIDIGPDLPDAMGYTPWVEEVFSNLISNAVKYIGQNNPDPLIMIRGNLQGDVVRYEIEDNGVGIPPEAQEKLFEMFTRFHKSEASGHGLGLSIVESIINKLDGELGVESIPGQGSTFWVTLPAPPS